MYVRIIFSPTTLTYAYENQNSPDVRIVDRHPGNMRKSSAQARPSILIAKSNRHLTLFVGSSPLRQYPVAIGKAATPTPSGNYAIATKILRPGGVLGTRWMGLNYDSYGIHGTSSPWLIGKMVSNGCIRMHNHNAEDLFSLIHVGTPVYIRD